eukprot:3060576-Rhodomonas_salina.2
MLSLSFAPMRDAIAYGAIRRLRCPVLSQGVRYRATDALRRVRYRESIWSATRATQLLRSYYYLATQSPVLRGRMAALGVGCAAAEYECGYGVLHFPTALRLCYAVSGTEGAYGATSWAASRASGADSEAQGELRYQRAYVLCGARYCAARYCVRRGPVCDAVLCATRGTERGHAGTRMRVTRMEVDQRALEERRRESEEAARERREEAVQLRSQLQGAKQEEEALKERVRALEAAREEGREGEGALREKVREAESRLLASGTELSVARQKAVQDETQLKRRTQVTSPLLLYSTLLVSCRTLLLSYCALLVSYRTLLLPYCTLLVSYRTLLVPYWRGAQARQRGLCARYCPTGLCYSATRVCYCPIRLCYCPIPIQHSAVTLPKILPVSYQELRYDPTTNSATTLCYQPTGGVLY